MSTHTRNKSLVVCLAFVASLTLASVGALLSSLAPAGLVPGLLVRIVPLAIVIPFVLLGFSAACDKCEDLLLRRRQACPEMLERESVVKPINVGQDVGDVVPDNPSATPNGPIVRNCSAPLIGVVWYSMRFEKVPTLEARQWHGQ